MINEEQGRNIFFDRSPVDLLAYILVSDIYGEIDNKKYFEIVKESIGKLAALLFLPVGDKPVTQLTGDLETRVSKIGSIYTIMICEILVSLREGNGTLSHPEKSITCV